LFEGLESRKLFAATATLAGGVLTINGTNSADTVELSKSGSSLKVKLNGVNKSFNYGSVTRINANLKDGNDSFKSSTSVKQRMSVSGGNGNDKIYSGGGNDSLRGDAGNDIMDGQTGDDDMRGGSGTDTADYSSRTYDLAIALNDIADDGIATGGHDNVHTDIENVKCGSGGDYVMGSNANNEIWGGGGGDELHGGNGNDKIHGGAGDDFIEGNAGNDTIWGDAGMDEFYGGTGTDTHFAKDGEIDNLNDVVGSPDTLVIDVFDNLI
jgi:Ca2+-binding RTX toxin-like protein